MLSGQDNKFEKKLKFPTEDIVQNRTRSNRRILFGIWKRQQSKSNFNKHTYHTHIISFFLSLSLSISLYIYIYIYIYVCVFWLVNASSSNNKTNHDMWGK